MKIKRTKTGKYTITGITPTQLQTMAAVLLVANERCFDEPEEDNGCYYSNEDFVCCLYAEEREALEQISEVLSNVGRVQ